jgi:hypothetical protein
VVAARMGRSQAISQADDDRRAGMRGIPHHRPDEALLHLAKGRRRRVAKWSLCPCSEL